VAVQPGTVMTSWRMFQVTGPDGSRSRHLVGRANREGRVSSPVVSLDLKTLMATTQSGRVYRLEGKPGRDGDADYVFDGWMRAVGCKAVRDVTAALVRLWHLRRLDSSSDPIEPG